MKRGFIAGLLLSFALGLLLIRLASAADPPPAPSTAPNPEVFHYQGRNLQDYSADNKALKQTGQWRWRFVSVPGCNSESIRPAIVAAFAQSSRYGMQIIQVVNALTESSRRGNEALQADGDPTAHAVYASCGSSFAAVCGGPPVIGCLGRGFPYNNDIDISTDMAAYFDVSQRAIANHELHHATGVWAEGYRTDGSFGASSDTSIMNVGPLSRHDLGPIEDARWWRTMGSPELKVLGYGFNGAWYVFACGFDANATRLSVLVDLKDGQGIRWAGVIKPLQADANGCMGVGAAEGLNIVVGAEYFVKQENAASWRVAFNEARVP